ncbi:hypothetical protein [Agaribacterium haliotis]|uniref:hypothetical protein n=1 Tax=Agaribacterium haliotis TaxID=2013869 RepID=UPI001303F621|nr:hypothetical protein [Agaribacterium haliotis]
MKQWMPFFASIAGLFRPPWLYFVLIFIALCLLLGELLSSYHTQYLSFDIKASADALV